MQHIQILLLPLPQQLLLLLLMLVPKTTRKGHNEIAKKKRKPEEEYEKKNTKTNACTKRRQTLKPTETLKNAQRDRRVGWTVDYGREAEKQFVRAGNFEHLDIKHPDDL